MSYNLNNIVFCRQKTADCKWFSYQSSAYSYLRSDIVRVTQLSAGSIVTTRLPFTYASSVS